MYILIVDNNNNNNHDHHLLDVFVYSYNINNAVLFLLKCLTYVNIIICLFTHVIQLTCI